jgi:hypothetical protein
MIFLPVSDFSRGVSQDVSGLATSREAPLEELIDASQLEQIPYSERWLLEASQTSRGLSRDWLVNKRWRHLNGLVGEKLPDRLPDKKHCSILS